MEGVTEIATGDGSAMAEGCGTARIVVRDPTSGAARWATISDVWHAPHFATNIISVSEIKKNGFFFTSELPGIVTAEGPVAICKEMYGLYLLEHDDTPLGSKLLSGPQLWQRKPAVSPNS
ncbi:uncharacterized protein N7515_005892 [Penicillium bovifimosum]|uniref:Retrovirus-related Pol polyprotein from transposon TNT 1-94-like beta-barrel domain-containing protein n=1 Tax=Penicillium bovifimosum TaxID=126998 RepID=A0A9W9GTY3_9EURO|nr:uncharacterized protein N7515_005892 [Penicillium bovifimosum]KAJ5129853.1 hypothetical protein N7515_005892 [Penicillium bovifimosum]